MALYVIIRIYVAAYLISYSRNVTLSKLYRLK